ncbi:MAG: 5'-nucleotidase C-terminal domain-containing protein [Pseudomonadales bacterium]|nr:5'-nucleotidase C-terminal domain-containing protein [Pseudomonadales bacterium]
MPKLLFAILILLLTACENPTINILAINDVYRIEGVDEGTNGGLARVRNIRQALQQQDDALIVTLAGDFLYPSLLSRRFAGKQMIDILNLDGKQGFDNRFLVTFGNHEFDQSAMKDAAALKQRIDESEFTWLGSNISFVEQVDFGTLRQLKNSVILQAHGTKIGFFSITTSNKHPEYISNFISYETTARQYSQQLRQAGADFVIALTHLAESQDLQILNRLGAEGPDLIIGGHEHNKLSHWSEDGARLVIKADAEARTAALISLEITPAKKIKPHFKYIDLDQSVDQSPDVQNRVEAWLSKHQSEFCAEANQPEQCLSTQLATSEVELIGAELEIRKYETNFANWILDVAKSSHATAQIALINSGGLRLNQNIPAGAAITQRHIEELIAYPTTLHLIEITGATLRAMLEHSIEDWTGNGWFLQTSGIRFKHDPSNQLISDIQLSDGTTITPDTPLKVVVNDFLLNKKFGQDGYTMLSDKALISDQTVDLKSLLLSRLSQAQTISPQLDGRICNIIERPSFCHH